jgi:F5/8 type C domain-containing protein
LKRCRECNREYADETMRFCLEDGTLLTVSSYLSEAAPTEILPNQPAANLGASIPTIPAQPIVDAMRSAQHETPRPIPVLTVGVIVIALLLMALVGLAGLFVYKQFADDAGKGNQPAVSGKPNGAESAGNNTKDASSETSSSQTDKPLKITSSASSVRLAVQSNTYYPANAIDGKRSTAWIEGAEGGPGLGEWIRFDFDREINLHRILIQPGYFKSPQIWAQNNRLATVTAEFSDGSSRELSFADRMDSQKMDIGNVRTRWVRFVIKSVYQGTDPDTAISEVAFEWNE